MATSIVGPVSATNPGDVASSVEPPMLSAEQRRVVGALIEKQHTTPDDYPLSPNSLMRATNQSTSRDPVVDYDQHRVEAVAAQLKELGLVRFVHRQGRVTTRYRHVLDEALGLDPPRLTIVAVLLLRGPQTAGELKTRTERLHRFRDVAEVQSVLESLAARTPPLVAAVGRRAGQKEARWVDLLGIVDAGDGSAPDRTSVDRPPASERTTTAVDPVERPGAGGAAGIPSPSSATQDLAGEVAALRREVAELRAVVESLLGDGDSL